MKYRDAFVGVLALCVLAGCSKEESLSQRAGSAVSGAAADFLTGVGEGVDEKMKMDLDTDASLAAHGLTVTLGKGRGMGSNRAAVYVVSKDAFDGQLIAKALDAEGSEIGRAVSDVALEADGATYVNFEFNAEMDGSLVRKYRVAVK